MATFLLVPGAGGTAWYWHRLVPALEQLGHRAIAVDLPAADDGAGLEAYADAIVAVGSGQGRVVVVGQSLGGFSAPLTCGRLDVAQLVFVNAMLPRPGETAGQWWENTGQAAARVEQARREGRTLAAELDLREEFFHDVPDAFVEEAFVGGGGAQSDRPFADVWPLPAWPDLPIHVLSGRADRFFPLFFQQRVARERLGLEPEVLPGGHCLALSQPQELAARLDACLVARGPA
ncbi:MAG: alpha/beta fold hydrolase [Candidatus Dormiibacterota bacterium]